MDHIDNKTSRLFTIDILRGFAIIFMVLDHSRIFFGPTAFDPLLDFTKTNLLLFFTRFVSNLSPIIFVFLAGVSAFFYKEKNDLKQTSYFLLTRGLWLVLLEFTLVNFGWNFSLSTLVLQVIWILGLSMIILSGLIWLPKYIIFLLAAIMILGHNMLDQIHVGNEHNLFNIFFSFLHQSNEFDFMHKFLGVDEIDVDYPILPWPGIMVLGYLLGKLFSYSMVKQKKIFWWMSVILLLGFGILRYFNIYGDPVSFHIQANFWQTKMNFLGTTKYPASLQYILLSLGIMFWLIPMINKFNRHRIVMIFGQVSLFFYLIHIPILHFFADVYSYSFYKETFWWFHNPSTWPKNYHNSLLLVYVVWIIVLLITFPICKWYREYKFSHPERKFLKYL